MNKPVFLVDVDGVVADFTELYLRTARAVLGYQAAPFGFQPLTWDIEECLDLTKAQKETVKRELQRNGIATHQQPLRGAQEGICLLAERGAEIVFVTAPLSGSPTWSFERAGWLLSRFGGHGTRVIHTDYKEYVSGDVLIDDKAENIRAWKKRHPGGVAVLWAAPSNASTPSDDYDARTNSWENVADLFFRQKTA